VQRRVELAVTLFADIAQLEAEGRPFVLCTVTAVQGSTPQKPGSRLVVLGDGSLRGTIGGGAIEKQVIEAALALFADASAETKTLDTHLTHELGMCCGGKMTVFLEKHGAPATLVVFGAGHVAKELAALAHHVGFRVTVVDERAEWLTAERFPNAERKLEPPDDVAKALSGGDTTYCCVTTHDHPLDQACTEALVKKPLAYLGVIGSERKALKFRSRMEAAGFSKEEVARFESPMGVEINALTPAEIAVSIVGRLISVRRTRK
jgi:xanthine dehydrogenase accessory factor